MSDLVVPTGPGGAVLSACERYRFLLWRIWSSRAPRMLFVGLNPSTADAMRDDPTVRRCVSFARREKCGGFELVNLFAQRSTNPMGLTAEPEPQESDAYIRDAIARCSIVVAAFGNSAMKVPSAVAKLGAARELLVVEAAESLGRDLLCLGRTKDGWPRHPLMVRNDTPLEPWVMP